MKTSTWTWRARPASLAICLALVLAGSARAAEPGAGRPEGCVDRIDEGVALLIDADEGQRTWPRAMLPAGAREGVCLVDGRLDHALTERRRAAAQALIDGLEARGRAPQVGEPAPGPRKGLR